MNATAAGDGGRPPAPRRGFANAWAAVEEELRAAAQNDPIQEAALGQEARLKGNVLLVFGRGCPDPDLARAFFGRVIAMATPDTEVDHSQLLGRTVYLCGDISWTATKAETIGGLLSNANEVFIVGPLSTNFDPPVAQVVAKGRVPLGVHGVGVLYRHFFDRKDIFERIQQEHRLVEPSGMYLTPVTRGENGDLNYRLLRCSTNLSTPTDNFRATDHKIVDSLNQEADRIFYNQASLNHVLAQIYSNTPDTQTENITKDMPTNGIVAFSTFYADLEKHLQRNSTIDPYDWVHNGSTSGLARLRFRLKDQVKQRGSPLIGYFYLTLYPNSVFFMPLSTSRLYTHEIYPSELEPEHLPIRLGYVARCSVTEAVHRDGKTFIQQPGKRKWEPMEPATETGVKRLKTLHIEAKSSEKIIDYGGQILFSMNPSDYERPNYDLKDEFRIFPLCLPANPYAHLKRSVVLEEIGIGRQGAIIVHSHPIHGTPLVRSTLKFQSPAQCFKTLHHQLANQIIEDTALSMPLNNALVEVCDNKYSEAHFQSHQAQDLAKGSHIALFSCYENPHGSQRKLVVESKSPDEGMFEIPLAHNGVIVWSVETNGRFRHKIVLDADGDGEPEANNSWLGFTFRTSSTVIQFRRDEGDTRMRPFFAETGMPLLLLEGSACGSLYQLRQIENAAMGFVYPTFLTSTISRGDVLPPVGGTKQTPAASMDGSKDIMDVS